MKKIIVIGSFLPVLFLAGCSGIPSRLQVQKRKSSSERLQDSGRDRERDFNHMRGTSRDNPSPGI